MKRLNRFVLLTLGYLVAVARVAGRRFALANKAQRAGAVIAAGLFVGFGTFLSVSASSAATYTAGTCSVTHTASVGVTVTKSGSSCIVKFEAGAGGNWTRPTGVKNARVLLVGGGAGGDRGQCGIWWGRGGGGGGVIDTSLTGLNVAEYQVAVGVGGAAGAPCTSTTLSSGGSGGQSYFLSQGSQAVELRANGGSGATTSTAGRAGAIGGQAGSTTINSSTIMGATGGDGDGNGSNCNGGVQFPLDGKRGCGAGGGGGAGGAGGNEIGLWDNQVNPLTFNASGPYGWAGGRGVTSNISGTSLMYGMGGAGRSNNYLGPAFISAGTNNTAAGAGGANVDVCAPEAGFGGGGADCGGFGTAGAAGVAYLSYALPTMTLATGSTGAISGEAFASQPSVQLKNNDGTNLSGSTPSVAVAVTSGTCTLSGTTTAAASSSTGLATFGGLSLTGARAAACVLSFTSTGFETLTHTITLKAKATGITISGASSDTGGEFVNGVWVTSSTGTSNISATALAAQLDIRDVLVEATSSSGDVIFLGSANVTKTSSGETTLTLKSAKDVYVNQDRTARINSTGGKLNLIVWSNSDGAGDGSIQVYGNTSAAIATNGGHVVLGGGSSSMVYGGLTAPSSDAYADGTDVGPWQGIEIYGNTSTSSKVISTAGGSVRIRGLSKNSSTVSGWVGYGVAVNGGLIDAGSGQVDIRGETTGSVASNVKNFGTHLYGTADSPVKIVASGGVLIAGKASASGDSVGVVVGGPSELDAGLSNTVDVSDIAGSTLGIRIAASLTSASNTVLTSTSQVSVDSTLQVSTANKVLTVKAATNVMVTASGKTQTNGGNLTLWSDTDATSGGGIKTEVGSSITSGGGVITLSGGTDPTTGWAKGTSTSGEAGVWISGSVNSGSGNLIIRGEETATATTVDRAGVFVDKGALISTAGSGDIFIDGKVDANNTNTANFHYGVWVGNADSASVGQVSTDAGDISIKADASGNTRQNRRGVIFNRGKVASVSGAVTVDAIAGTSTTGCLDVYFFSDTNTVESATGAVVVKGGTASSSGFDTGSINSNNSVTLQIAKPAVNSTKTLTLGGSGDKVIEYPAAASDFAAAVDTAGFAFGTSSKSIRIGTASVDKALTVTSAIAATGPISLLAKSVKFIKTAGLDTSRLANSAILVKAKLWIQSDSQDNANSATKFVTDNGDITFWTASAGGTDGSIVTGNYSFFDTTNGDKESQATGGGRITFGGGSVGAAGVPTGPTLGGTNSSHGIYLNAYNRFYSGGGDIWMFGKSASGVNAGLLALSDLVIDSGQGQISLRGDNDGGNGQWAARFGYDNLGDTNIISEKTTGTAIEISANSTTYASLWINSGSTSYIVNIAATGGGAVTLTGTGSTSYVGVAIDRSRVLSASGKITIDGGPSFTSLGYNSRGEVYLGAKSDSLFVSSSTADILVKATSYVDADNATTMAASTTGALVVESAGTSFTSASNWGLTTATGSFRFGKSGESQNSTISGAVTSGGTVEVYGNTIEVSAAMEGSAVSIAPKAGYSGAGSLKAKSGALTIRGGTTVAPTGAINASGKITLAGSGNISTATNAAMTSSTDAVEVTTTGGTVVLANAVKAATSIAITLTGAYSGAGSLTAGSTISVSGGTNVAPTGNLQAASNIALSGSGQISLTSITVNTTGGYISLTAGAYAGDAVVINAATVSSRTQPITVSGTSTSGTGVYIYGGSTVSTTSGDITITGVGSGWGTMFGLADIISSSGDIYVDAGAKGMVNGYGNTTNLGATPSGAASGDITILADRNWGSSSTVNYRTSGAVVINSKSSDYSEDVTYNNHKFYGCASVTISNPNVTWYQLIDVTADIAGPFKAYGDYINFVANSSVKTAMVKSTGSTRNVGVLVKAKDRIHANAGVSFETAGADISIWSDSDSSGVGAVYLAGTNVLKSMGGNISIAGGADNGATGNTEILGRTAGDDSPDNYAAGYYNWGVDAGVDLLNGHQILSGGGDIFIAGRGSAQAGLNDIGISVRGGLIYSGSGKIAMYGKAPVSCANSWHRGIFTGYGAASNIVSESQATDSIYLYGNTSSCDNGWSVYASAIQGSNGYTQVAAPNGGGVKIYGIQGNASYYEGSYGSGTAELSDILQLNYFNLIANSGPIDINAVEATTSDRRGIRFATRGAVRSYVGSLSANYSTTYPAYPTIFKANSTSDVTLKADRICPYLTTFNTTGNLKFIPDKDFKPDEILYFSSNWGVEFPLKVASFTLGAAGSSAATQTKQDIDLLAVSSVGAVKIYGADMTFEGDISSDLSSGTGVLLKSTANITTLRSITTQGADAVVWSRAASSDDTTDLGRISVENASNINTNGGKIILAGSSSVDADGLPNGHAFYSSGIAMYLGTTANAPVNLNSGNGLIRVYAKAGSSAGLAIALVNNATLATFNSGSGRQDLHFVGTGTSDNVFETWGPITFVSSADASDSAPAIKFYVSQLNSGNSYAPIQQQGSKLHKFVASGGGKLDVTIISAKTSVYAIDVTQSFSFLASSGDIRVDTGVNGLDLTSATTAAPVYFGADATSTSSSNITIIGDRFKEVTANSNASVVTAKTSGTVTIKASSQSFSEATAFDATWAFTGIANVNGANVGSVTIGQAGTSAATQNTSNITLSGAIASAGNLQVYGGDIVANANLTGTGLDGRILLKAVGSIAQAASTTLRTNSGKIVLWSDSDATNGGNIILKGSICTAPTATTCDANATSGGDDVVIGGGAASVSDGALPGGYATGAATTDYNTTSGVVFGTLGTAGTGAKVYSSGGNVNISGRTFVTAGSISSYAFGVIFMSSSEVHAGVGKIYVEGNNSTGSTSSGYRYPLEWNAWGGTTKFTSTNSSSDSITVRAIETRTSNGINANNAGAEFKNPNGGLLIQTDNFMASMMATVNVGGAFVLEPVGDNFSTAYALDSDIVWGANVPGSIRIGKSGNTADISISQASAARGNIEVYGGAIVNSALVQSTGGTISYTGSTFGNTAALSTDGRDITVTADQMTIGASLTTNKTSGGIVSLIPKTSGKNVDLGATDSGSLLGLTDTELDFAKASVLRIGSASAANNINVSANISIAAASAPSLAIRGAGNVTNSNSAIISAQHLAISVNGTINLPGSNGITGNLALVAAGASAGSGVAFGTSGSYTADAVDSITPVYGLGKNISVSSAPAVGSTEVRYLNQTWSAPPVVTVKDAYGYVIEANNSKKTAYTTTLTGSGTPTIAGATPVVSGGTQTFSALNFSSIGTTALTFSTANLVAGGTSSVTTGTYDVQGGEPASLAITYDATEAPAGKIGFGIKVTLKDAGGNTVSGPHATDAITVDVSDGDADSTNNAAVIAGGTPSTVAGQANFSTLRLSGKVGVTYSLTFTVTYVDSTSVTRTRSATRTVTLTPGDATKLKVQTPAAGFVNRTTFSTQPVIAVKDAYDNTVPSAGTSVSVAVSAVGTASTQGLSGTLSATTNASGIATFVGLGKTGLVGDKRLTFSATNLSSDTQDFTLTYGAANKLAMTSPASTVNDTVFATQPVVTIQDEDGNTVTGSTSTVTLTSSNATIGGTLLNSAVAMDAVAGVSNFSGKNVKLTGTIGSRNLTATITGGITLTNQVTITFGAATKLVLSRDAADAVNGVAFLTQPQVVVKDISDNIVTNSTATITVESSGSVLSGNSTPPTLVNGVATFSGLKLTGTKGTYVLTYKSTGLVDATQNITVAYGAATKLVLTTQPLGFVNRTNFTTQPVITVQDASGNTVENSTISIDVAIDSGNLTGTTQIAAVNGIATFSGLGKNGTIGSKRLTFTKTGGGLSQDIFDFTLVYGAATKLTLTTSAAGFVNRVAFTTQPVIQVQDADGNKVADSTASVTVAMTGGGTLSGTKTINAVAGVATFSGLSASGLIANNNVLAFTSSQLTGTSQASFNLTHGAAHHMYVSASNDLGTRSILSGMRKSGIAFGQQPKVAVVDEDNNLVTTGQDATQTVTVAASAAGLSGTTTVTASAGLATFSGLTMTALAGNYTLTFTANASGSTGNTPFDLSFGTATKLAVTTLADGFVNRANFTTQPVVTVQDSMGNTVTDTPVSIDVAIDSGTLTGTTQVRSVAGVATFSGLGKYGAVAAKRLTFSKTGGGLTVDTQDFTLTFGAIHHLNVNVVGTLANDTAWATQPVVAIQDQDDNTVDITDTVTLTASGATTVAIGGTTSMQTTNGVANFIGKGVKLTGLAGSKTLTAAITSGSGFAKDTSITLGYGAATKLALTTEPAGFVNRTTFSTQPAVTVQDVSGNTVANSSISIDVSIDSGDVTGTTRINAVAGVATFAGLGKAGTIGLKTLTFKDTAGLLTPATKQFTLTHGAAHHTTLAVASTLANNTAFATQPVVTIYDQDDNVVTSGSQSTQTVTLSVSGASTVAISGSVTMDAADGVANFSGKGVKLTGLIGAKSLTATIASPSSIIKTETVTITYGAATKLAISTDAADASNGSAFGTQPVILVQDFSGNLVANSTVNVTASISNGTLDGTDTVPVVAGVATFTNLGLTATAGAKTLTFSSSPLTAATQSITAVTGAPTQLRIDVANTLVNNTVFATQPVITLLDATGVVVSAGANSTRTVTLSSPDATIGGTVSMAAVAGVADFTGLAIKLTGTIGARSLVATISSPSTVTATAPITITYGAAHHLNISSGASGIANRIAFTNQPVIEVLDVSGNRVENSAATISVAATGANGAVLGGDTTMNATAGIAYFAQNTNKLKLTGAVGDYRLTYTSGSLSGDAEDVTLTHGAATKIVVSRAASGAKSGQAFTTQPKIQVQDADSNLVNTGAAASAQIRIAVSSDAYDSASHIGVDLTGSANFEIATASAGEATFASARLEGVAATYTLKFETLNTSGFNGVTTSQTLALTAGTETHLAIVQQPTAIVAGAAFSPVVTVEILDDWNNRVLDVANTVAVKPTLVDAALSGNTIDATKSAVANSSGLVTFTGLTFTKAGTQYVRFTTTAGLTSATSSSFTITNAQAHHLTWVNPSAAFSAKNDYAIKDGANANPELEVRDQYENPVLTGNATSVAVTESTSSADVKAISGASVSSDAYARVSFANLVMRAKTGSYTLNFTAANASLPIHGDVETATVSISHGDPSALRLTRNASGANVGLPFTTQPKLNIEDTAGNVVADSALAITVSENVSQVLSGTTTKNATAGSVDFTDSGLKLDGTVQTGIRLKYAVTYNGTEISTSQDIDLDPGLAFALTIGQQPTTVKTRVAFNPVPTVILRDASGNQVTADGSSTVTAQLKDAGGNPVGSETSAFTASGGVVTFTGLSFQAPSTAGYYVTFKLVSNGVATTSNAFDILPGVATELRITRQPSTDAVDHTPGKTGELLSTQPIAKLYDQDGNLVTTANTGVVTIRVKSTDSAGDLSEGTVTANITGGIANFSGVKFVGTPGVSYTLDFATATPNPTLTSLATLPISVTHNDATHLVVTRAASSGRSGEAFGTAPIITIKDRYNNTVTSGSDANRRVTVTGDVTAPVVGSANLSNASATASNGVATFNALTLTGSVANTYRLNFSIVGSAITAAAQSNLTISYGYESQIAITRQPVGGNATGTHLATQPVIEIRDSAGNRVADSTYAVAASINSTAGLLLSDGSAARLAGSTKSAVGGIATFDTLDLYGLPGTNYELKFEVSGLPIATSNPIQVIHAAAHHLTITQQPTGGNATGSSLAGQPTVQLRDQFENVVSADSTDVVTARLSTTSARERLEGNYTVTLANGVGAFAGLKVIALPDTDYTLDFTVTAGGTSITSSATNGFRVTYSTPTQLAVAQEPSGGTTGVALNTQPIVEVQDVYGNRVYNFVGNVTAAVSTGATLTNGTVGTLSMAVSSGQAVFSGLAVTGTPLTDYQLTFTSGALTSVNSGNIRVTPGAPVRIVILNQPIGAANRAALAGMPVVELQDSFGNRVTQDSSTVITAALTSGADGTLTRVVSSNSVAIQATTSNGVATFSNLYMRGLTNRNYKMTFSSGDLVAAESANYSVSHAAVANLIWNTQPAVGMTGSALTRAAVLELQDLDGNIAETDSTTVVTATITTGVGGTLSSATATANNGIVTFTNLTLTGTPGVAYKLTFTGTIGSTVVSASESVTLTPTHAVPAKVTMRVDNVTGGLSGQNLTTQPSLYIRDRFNNIATSDNSTVVTASILNDLTGTVSGNVTATAVNGAVTFAGLKVSGTPGTPYKLRFTSGSLTHADSSDFTVSKIADVSLAYTAQAYSPNAVVAAQFSTDSPGDITYSTNASSTVCTLNRGTGALTIKGVGNCLIRVEVDTDQAGFYLANFAEATLVISKAQQAAVTINSAATVDYWSSLNPSATGGTGTGALSYSVVSGSTCRLIGATILPGEAGSLCQITATRAGDDNYLPQTSAVQTIEVRKINQATLTIASAQTIDAVDTHTLFTAGGSGTGAVTYSIVSSGTARCRLAGAVLTANASGLCTIRATKAGSTNYNPITSANQVVTVNLEDQTVAFTSTAPMYPVVGGSYTPTATATSSLAVTYSIATNSNSVVACSFDSAVPSKINFVATGVCEIVATQVGSSRYGYASVRQMIRIGLLNQTINFDMIPELRFGTPAFKLLPTTNAGANATIALATTSNSTACSIAGDIVTLTSAGYCEISANQSGYGSYAAATEVIRGFNVLADFAGAPRIFSTSVTTHALTASFTAPSYTGGAPITGFALIATDANGQTYENAGCQVGTSPITCTIVGLPNDIAYTAVARAITAAGMGAASNVTAAQTPMDAPVAVTNLTAATSNNDLVVTWSPPNALDGDFLRYDIFIAPVGSQFSATTPYNVTDVNATSTTIQNVLNQSISPSPQPTESIAPARISFRRASISSPSPSASSSAPSSGSSSGAGFKVQIVTITSNSTVASNMNTTSGMQTNFSVPLTPSQLTLTVAGADLMTSWSAPTADGGSPVTGYDVKVNGSVICQATTSLFCEFTGMQPGRTYSVEVVAINAVGFGAAAASSHSVAALPPTPGSNAAGSAMSNGMAILGVSAKTALTSGGQLLTLNTRNFAGIISALLDGKPVKIVSNSEDHITLELPEHSAGSVDLTFKSKLGTLVFQDAVTFVAPPRADAKQTFSRYRTNFVATNARMIASISAVIQSQEKPKAMVCVGLVPVKYTANDIKLAKIRAANVCAIGAKLDGNLAVRATTGITKLNGPAARAVKVTYKY